MFIGSLIPFNYCLSYINYTQDNIIFTFPSALVLIRESMVPREGLTQFLDYYESVLNRPGWYHVWHNPENYDKLIYSP